MQAYLDLLRHVLEHGRDKPDRTGTGTRSVFGHQMRFDLAEGFPCVTTKKLHLRSVIYELLWFLRGDTNVRFLNEHGVRIWDEWADADGELGPIYGHQWRSFPKPGGGTVDQVAAVLRSLREEPHSRRHLVCAWNPGQLEEMALPPCHCLFQFYISPPGKLVTEPPRGEARGAGAGLANLHNNDANQKPRLSCQLYQRSADVFLGVPFNIASYALLTQMMAHVLGLAAGEFIHTLGDAHLYRNHFDQAREQLTRAPRPLPTLRLDPGIDDLFDFTYEDIEVVGYDPHPTIKAPIAV